MRLAKRLSGQLDGRMQKAFCIAALLVLLAGCTTSSGESIQGPSGATIQQAKCSASPNACFKKAAADCGGPYQVIDSSSKAGGLVADILPGPVTWYQMSYQCGPSDGRMPAFPFRGATYSAPTTCRTTVVFGTLQTTCS